jgi:hypothetical protein
MIASGLAATGHAPALCRHITALMRQMPVVFFDLKQIIPRSNYRALPAPPARQTAIPT